MLVYTGEMGKVVLPLEVDWTSQNARYLSGGNITLQVVDPSDYCLPIPVIKKMVHEMIDEFGKRQISMEFGHGILPNIPVDHAKHLSMQ
jgi:uroporphyrinogen decarboxylase